MEEKSAVTPETPTFDYKAAYEKKLAEIDSLTKEVEKQKGLKDDYARENRAYKDKEKERLPEEEKRKQEQQEMLEKYKAMENEVAQMKLEKDLLANGFTTEESEKLVKSGITVEAVKPFAEIIKARVDSSVKSATAEFTKNSTSQPLMGKGSADGNAKSDFQVHQESKKKSSNIVELN